MSTELGSAKDCHTLKSDGEISGEVSASVSLEQVKKELGELGRESYSRNAPGVRSAVREARHGNRFGEVIAAFLSEKTMKGVCEKTGIKKYTLVRYYLNDPQFRDLLRSTNEAIFQDATSSLREEQSSFVEKAKELAWDSLQEMEHLLHESENEHIRFKVAQDLLDRDPEGRATRVKRVDSPSTTINFDLRTVQLLANVAKESEGG